MKELKRPGAKDKKNTKSHDDESKNGYSNATINPLHPLFCLGSISFLRQIYATSSYSSLRTALSNDWIGWPLF